MISRSRVSAFALPFSCLSAAGAGALSAGSFSGSALAPGVEAGFGVSAGFGSGIVPVFRNSALAAGSVGNSKVAGDDSAIASVCINLTPF